MIDALLLYRRSVNKSTFFILFIEGRHVIQSAGDQCQSRISTAVLTADVRKKGKGLGKKSFLIFSPPEVNFEFEGVEGLFIFVCAKMFRDKRGNNVSARNSSQHVLSLSQAPFAFDFREQFCGFIGKEVASRQRRRRPKNK